MKETHNVQELTKDFVNNDRDFLDSQEPKIGQYHRKCKGIFIDVYDVIKAFNVTNPASQHAIKKMLASGQRGVKYFKQDLIEAIQALDRAIELED